MANRITLDQVINNESCQLGDDVELRTCLINEAESKTSDSGYLNEVVSKVTGLAHFNFAKMRSGLGEHPTVLEMALTLAAAELGSRDAQYNLGCSHLYGTNGLKIDTPKAVKWFELAADQSDPDAGYNLGCVYRYRYRIISQAIKWFTPLADQGDRRAQHELDIINQTFEDPKEWDCSELEYSNDLSR